MKVYMSIIYFLSDSEESRGEEVKLTSPIVSFYSGNKKYVKCINLDDEKFQNINLLEEQELILPTRSNENIKLSEADIKQFQNGISCENYLKMIYKILKRYGFEMGKDKWYKNRNIFEYTNSCILYALGNGMKIQREKRNFLF